VHDKQTKQQAILNLVFQGKLTPEQADVMLNEGFRCKVTEEGKIAVFFPGKKQPIEHETGDWAWIFERAEDIQAFISKNRRLIDEKVKNALCSCKPEP
jgi:hypothetical protein